MLALSTLVVLVGVGPLSADDAVRLALETNPLLEALTHRIDEEEGPRTLGLLFKNPELRVAARHLERTVDPTSTPADVLDRSSIGLRVPVPPLTATGFEQSARARHVDATRADLAEERRRLSERVRILHARLLNIDARLDLIKAQIELALKTQDLVRKRIDAGVATRFDESIAALDHASVVIDHESLLAERRLADAELKNLLSVPASEPLLLVADELSPCHAIQKLHASNPGAASARSPDAESAAVEAVDPLDVPVSAPVLAGLDARIAEEENMRTTRFVELIPWVRFAALDYRLGVTRQEDSLRFQVGIPLPLLNFNQDDIRTHTARIARLRAERRHKLSLISGDLRVHRENLAGQHALLSLYEETTAPVIAESLTLVDEAFALGEGDPVQMTMVTARSLKAKKNALETRLRCDEAAIAWLARAGRDPTLGDADARTGL